MPLNSNKKSSRKTKTLSQISTPLSGKPLLDLLEIQRKSFFDLLEHGIVHELTKIDIFRETATLHKITRELELSLNPETYKFISPTCTPKQAILKGKTYACKLYVQATLVIRSGAQKEIQPTPDVLSAPLHTPRACLQSNAGKQIKLGRKMGRMVKRWYPSPCLDLSYKDESRFERKIKGLTSPFFLSFFKRCRLKNKPQLGLLRTDHHLPSFYQAYPRILCFASHLWWDRHTTCAYSKSKQPTFLPSFFTNAWYRYRTGGQKLAKGKQPIFLPSFACLQSIGTNGEQLGSTKGQLGTGTFASVLSPADMPRLRDGMRKVSFTHGIGNANKNNRKGLGKFTYAESVTSKPTDLESNVGGKTYAPPKVVNKWLKAHQLSKDNDVQIFQPWIFIGELPLMTKRGHFILNGSPRVIVNQIARCPGIYFQEKRRGVGFEQEIRVSADLIPQRGPWLRIQSDWEGRFWARLKQEGRVKYAILYEAFLQFEKQYSAPLASRLSTSSSPFLKSEIAAFQERKAKEDRQKNALIRLFKNSTRYSLGKLGRFRLNHRVHSSSLNESIRLRNILSITKSTTFPELPNYAKAPSNRNTFFDKKNFNQINSPVLFFSCLSGGQLYPLDSAEKGQMAFPNFARKAYLRHTMFHAQEQLTSYNLPLSLHTQLLTSAGGMPSVHTSGTHAFLGLRNWLGACLLGIPFGLRSQANQRVCNAVNPFPYQYQALLGKRLDTNAANEAWAEADRRGYVKSSTAIVKHQKKSGRGYPKHNSPNSSLKRLHSVMAASLGTLDFQLFQQPFLPNKNKNAWTKRIASSVNITGSINGMENQAYYRQLVDKKIDLISQRSVGFAQKKLSFGFQGWNLTSRASLHTKGKVAWQASSKGMQRSMFFYTKGEAVLTKSLNWPAKEYIFLPCFQNTLLRTNNSGIKKEIHQNSKSRLPGLTLPYRTFPLQHTLGHTVSLPLLAPMHTHASCALQPAFGGTGKLRACLLSIPFGLRRQANRRVCNAGNPSFPSFSFASIPLWVRLAKQPKGREAQRQMGRQVASKGKVVCREPIKRPKVFRNTDTVQLHSTSIFGKSKLTNPLLLPEVPVLPTVSDSHQIGEPQSMKKNQPDFVLMAQDISAIHGYLQHLLEGQGFTDDIDHLKNRFVRTSGKLLQQQFELGLQRLNEVITPLLGNLLQGHLAFLNDSSEKRKSNISVPPSYQTKLGADTAKHIQRHIISDNKNNKKLSKQFIRGVKPIRKAKPSKETLTKGSELGKKSASQKIGIEKAFLASQSGTDTNFSTPRKTSSSDQALLGKNLGTDTVCQLSIPLPLVQRGYGSANHLLTQRLAKLRFAVLRTLSKPVGYAEVKAKDLQPKSAKSLAKEGQITSKLASQSLSSDFSFTSRRVSKPLVPSFISAYPTSPSEMIKQARSKNAFADAAYSESQQVLSEKGGLGADALLTWKSFNKKKPLQRKGKRPTTSMQTLLPLKKGKHTAGIVAPFRWLRTSKPVNGAFREFFGSNPLSQYMDQTNPLAEITHKRRLSSMGPGGIKRETAGMEVRGIHPTHYGRVCPIETPEGKNAGLVNSPTVYSRVDNYGFLETPLYQVVESQVQMKKWIFLSAQQEENEKSSLATCDTGLMQFNLLPHVPIPVQTANNPLAHFQQVERSRVGYKSLSPVQTISIATALIPFLEHDDANRALMGSNMQRQAIPLLLPERPVVGTGFEPLALVESGQALQATQLGCVSYVNAGNITVHSIYFTEKALSFANLGSVTRTTQIFSTSLEDSHTDPYPYPYPKGMGKGMGMQGLPSWVAYSSSMQSGAYLRQNKFYCSPRKNNGIGKKVINNFCVFLRYLHNPELIYPLTNPSISAGPTAPPSFQTTLGTVCQLSIPVGSANHLLTQRACLQSNDGDSKPFGYLEEISPHTLRISSIPTRGERVNTDSKNKQHQAFLPPVQYRYQALVKKLGKKVNCLSSKSTVPQVVSQSLLGKRLSKKFTNKMVNLASKAGFHISASHNILLLKPARQALQLYQRSNQETCLTQRPLVQEGQWVQRGDFLADCSASHSGDLALGKNVTVAYMPWEGYNFEDAIVISDRLISDDVYTSLHIERYEIKVNKNSQGKERITNRIPGTFRSFQHLDNSGIACVSSWVQPGDILVGKVVELKRPLSPYERLAWELASRLSPASPEREKWLNKVWLEDISLRLPPGVCGRVINSQIVSSEWSEKEQKAYPLEVHVYLAVKRKIQVGDKLAGRHGNKGIVSTILPRQDMPYLADGTSIDMVLNPLGVPSRMNVGQIFECLLGLAGSQLGCNFKITPFDEIAGGEASRSLVFLKLYQCRLMHKQQWLFTPSFPGKSKLFDGRTGEPFENWVTVGQAYMLKLIHMVDHKIHARSIGPYSLFTRQPVRGRSRRGGQRLGEMEVWAVEGFGAAYTLQEFLTIKSDDLKARTALQRGFYKQNDVTFGKIHISPGNPEAFKVLVSELQALCLHIQME